MQVNETYSQNIATIVFHAHNKRMYVLHIYIMCSRTWFKAYAHAVNTLTFDCLISKAYHHVVSATFVYSWSFRII